MLHHVGKSGAWSVAACSLISAASSVQSGDLLRLRQRHRRRWVGPVVDWCRASSLALDLTRVFLVERLLHCAGLRCGDSLAYNLTSPLSSAAERAALCVCVLPHCGDEKASHHWNGPLCKCKWQWDRGMWGMWGREGGGSSETFCEACGQQRSRAGFQNTASLAPKQAGQVCFVFWLYSILFFDRNLRQSHFGHVSLIHSAKNSCQICVNPPAWSVLESK